MIKKPILFTIAVLTIAGGIAFAMLGEKFGSNDSAEKAGKHSQDPRPSPGIDKQHQEKHGAADHEGERHVKVGENERKKLGIEVSTAGPGSLGRELTLSGEIVLNTDRMAHIVPRVPGVVREVRKSLGDRVKQGEVMAVIESPELARAKADYLAAVEKAALAESKFTREEALWKEQISAEVEYLDSKQALAEARITLRSEEQRLRALGFSNEYLKRLSKMDDDSYVRFEILSPFDGTVIEKHIARGEVLKEETEVFLVADLSSVWVNVAVHQKDAPSVQKGQTVSIFSDPDYADGRKQAKAAISYVSPIIKEETRTALARLTLPNPDGNWRPGMFVNAKVMVEEFSVPVMIPESALQTLEEETVVFVEEGEGFEPRPVKAGRKVNGRVEILSGISRGERFAGAGAYNLKAQLFKADFGDDHGHGH